MTEIVKSTKAIFKDFLLFYVCFFVVFTIAAFVQWLYVHFYLEAVTYHGQVVNFNEDGSKPDTSINLETYIMISKMIGHYLLIFICFLVFFRKPPKRFIHILVTAFLLFFLQNIVFFKSPDWEMAYYFLWLLGNMMVPWILSHALYEYEKRKKVTV